MVDAGIYAWIKREQAAGNIFAGDDGFYVWAGTTPGGGYLDEYSLLEMVKYLAAKNALMQWEHEHDPAISGST